MFTKKRLRVVVIFVGVIALLSATCFAGIRVKPHGGEVLDPHWSYIVSETVVENDRLISDKIICTDYTPNKAIKKAPTISEIKEVVETAVKPLIQSVSKQPASKTINKSVESPSRVNKVLKRWGIRLLHMFVCNVDDY